MVGLFLLSKVKEDRRTQNFTTSLGLYRDDLILVTKIHGSSINSIKSALTKIFQEEDLKLCEWEEGVKQNYLDINFDLSNCT